MGALNLGHDGPGGIQARSYIPPHMRGRQNPGPPPPVNGAGPQNGMNGGPPPQAAVNGIGNSAWAR